MATKTTKTKAAEPTAAKPKAVGVTSGVMAPGKVGKAAREAAAASQQPGLTGWRDPEAKYADNDNSIDARMSRLTKEIRDQ